MNKPPLLALAGLLLAPLAPQFIQTARAADAGCAYVKLVDLPIRYVGRALAPAVDGSINGKAATMLVDTGSYQSLLTMTGVVRRGMELHWGEARVSGVGGQSRLYSARIDEIGIGPARSNRQFVLPVIGDTASAFEFDALLGATFLLRRDLMLDLRNKRMAFYMPQGCDKAETQRAEHYLWEENTIVVPFRHNAREEAAYDTNPHFTVVVNGQRVDAEIDSGAHRSFLTLAAAERVGIDVGRTGTKRAGGAQGVGSDRAPSWIVPVKSVQISNETVNNVELGVVDVQSGVRTELFLGQDFLRAHRVLFAMSQEKLYLAYLGGDVFTRGTSLEPWMRQEAEAGNADAQYLMARVEDDAAASNAWLRKAAAGGQPHASLALARVDMDAGRHADAIPKLRAALDRLPSDRVASLWLYVARLRTGEAALGKSELEASLKAQNNDEWPYPVAQFYLGKWDAARVLAAAGQDRVRACMAQRLMDEFRIARGESTPNASGATALQCEPAP